VPDEVPDWYKIGRERIRVPKRRKEVAFLLATLSQLTKKGRLGIILPVGFTFDESLRKIRRVLLEENLVEAIVQLPEGSFPYTTVKTVLLILDKNRTNENKRSISMGVLPFSTKNAENENNNFHRFLSAYHKSESVENWFVASIEDIQKEDYSLLPFRYVGAVTDELESLLRDKKVKRLEDICRIIRGRKRRPVEDLKGVPFVSTKDLSSDVTEPYLNFEDLNLSSAQTGDHIISQKCILVSLVGRSPKPTIFSPERAHIGTEESDTYIGILPNSNIACLVPNENIVDLEYFYFQLTTSLFKKQYEILSTGVGIPNVSIRSLRSIVIPVLPLQEQREVTRQLKEAFFKEANARLEALRANLNFDAKKQEAEYRIVRHLSHNLRHKITDIQSSFKHIGVFLKEKGLLEDLIQEKLSSDDQVETVGEVIGKSLLELKHMHNLLEKTRDLIIKKINSDDFKLIYLDQLFKEKVIQKANSKNYSIKLSGKTKSQVYIEETNFLEMISNLIKNAELHGFTDTSVKYEIRFDFSESPQSIFIDYSNNGDPLPPEFNLESFYGYGVKRIGSPGEGLGGAFIEKVIMAHKGEMQIISRDPVHFRIMIPKGEGNEQR
jgi:signal transduction histidine kinase